MRTGSFCESDFVRTAFASDSDAVTIPVVSRPKLLSGVETTAPGGTRWKGGVVNYVRRDSLFVKIDGPICPGSGPTVCGVGVGTGPTGVPEPLLFPFDPFRGPRGPP